MTPTQEPVPVTEPTPARYAPGSLVAGLPRHFRHLSSRGLLVLLGMCVAAGCASTVQSPGLYEFDRPDEFLTTAEHYERWMALLAEQDAEQHAIRACLDDEADCPRYLRGYRIIIERAAAENPERQIRVVNQFINQRRWREKPRSEGWQTLGAFFRRGGSCEDVAIAKYFVLRELGFPAEDLRVVIARDPSQREFHAVLAVNLDGEAHLLDVDNSVLTGMAHRRYRYLVSMNELAVWEHGGLR
jgi:predicted transglutaminase-like cysteine proteinase